MSRRIFAEIRRPNGQGLDHRRLDILFHNRYEGGRRMIIEVALTDSGDDFSHQSTLAMDNYDNFDQTIMGLEVSQTEDPLSQAY